MATYYENITETVCYLNPSEHRLKLFKYRRRANRGKDRKAPRVVVRCIGRAAKPAGGDK